MKRLLIISSLFLLLILTSCTSVPDNCKGLKDSSLNACIIKEAINTNNPGLCANFKEDSLNNWCYSDLAKATNNIDLCNNINKKDSKNYCKRDIILKNNNVEACELLAGLPRDDCLHEFALRNNDWNLCVDISDRDLKDACLNKLAKDNNDTEACKAMSIINLEEKNNCLYWTSMDSLDYESCKSITDKMRSEFCIANIAGFLKNETLCESLKLTEAQIICLQKIKDNQK